jgi:hypothetical protein
MESDVGARPACSHSETRPDPASAVAQPRRRGAPQQGGDAGWSKAPVGEGVGAVKAMFGEAPTSAAN